MQRSCPKCGFDLGDNLRYCDNCGHVLWSSPRAEEKAEESLESLIIAKPDDLENQDLKNDNIRAAIERAIEIEDTRLKEQQDISGSYAKEKITIADKRAEAEKKEKRDYIIRWSALIALTIFMIFVLVFFFRDAASRTDIIASPLIFKGKVYYASTSDNSRLYSIKLNGTEKTRLSDLSIDSVSITRKKDGKDIIVYSAPGFGIYRRIDSNNKRMLYNYSASELFLTEGKLFFIPDFNGAKQLSYVDLNTFEVFVMTKMYGDNLIYTTNGFLYRNLSMKNEIWVNVTARDRRVIGLQSKGFAYNNGNIYFINSAEKDYIYAAKAGDLSKVLSVKDFSLVAPESANLIKYDSGWIYYTGGMEKDLHRIKADGTGFKLIIKGPIEYFDVSEGKISYFESKSKRLMRADADGSNITRLD